MKRLLPTILGFAFGALLPSEVRAYVIPPEPLLDLGGGVEALTGVWSANVAGWGTSSERLALQLSLRQGSRGGTAPQTLTCPAAGLQNLTRDQLAGTQPSASFELTRDAGILRFAGRFQSGEGAGHFSFVPSAEFLSDMRGLGYSGIDTEKAYTLAVLDVSRRFVQELAELGHRGLSLEQLIALRAHGVDPPFIRALKGLGYDYLPADRLVTFKIHGVSPEFIQELKAAGYPNLGPYDLVTFRLHGVSAQFVRDLLALGYRGVAPSDLVNLRVHGVTADFVRRINANTKTAVPVTRLVDLRIQGR